MLKMSFEFGLTRSTAEGVGGHFTAIHLVFLHMQIKRHHARLAGYSQFETIGPHVFRQL